MSQFAGGGYLAARFAKQNPTYAMSRLVLILLAIFLPPLAVYLKTHSGKHLIINIILCFLFWIPAVLHALYLVVS